MRLPVVLVISARQTLPAQIQWAATSVHVSLVLTEMVANVLKLMNAKRQESIVILMRSALIK